VLLKRFCFKKSQVKFLMFAPRARFPAPKAALKILMQAFHSVTRAREFASIFCAFPSAASGALAPCSCSCAPQHGVSIPQAVLLKKAK